jgi:integrase
MTRRKKAYEPYKTTIGGRVVWQVNSESEYRIRESDGVRVRVRPRRTFTNAVEARTFAKLKAIERINHGTAGVSMDEQVRGDALAAREILRPFSATLLDAAREYARRRELVTRSCTVTEAIKACLDAKKNDNLRPKYLKDLRLRLTRFGQDHGDRKMSDITPAEIDQWLRGLSLMPLGRNTFRSRLSTLFEFSRQSGWVTSNPVAETRKVKVGESIPGILTPDQAARLLEAADHQTLPYWALGLFCGLRSAELQRLSWSDIHFDEAIVEVPSLAAKTASRRCVPIRPNLAHWLEPYRDMHGPLCPANLEVRLKTDRRNAGITNWPTNGCRHSFGSYHLTHFRNSSLTASEMGHVSAAITYKHYYQRVRPAAAAEYWQIAPADSHTALVIVA